MGPRGCLIPQPRRGGWMEPYKRKVEIRRMKDNEHDERRIETHRSPSARSLSACARAGSSTTLAFSCASSTPLNRWPRRPKKSGPRETKRNQTLPNRPEQCMDPKHTSTQYAGANAIAALEAVAKRAGDSAPQEVESTVQSHPKKGR